MKTNRRQALAAPLIALFAAPTVAAPQAAAQANPTPAVTGPLSRFIAAGEALPIDEETLDLGRRHILDTLASIVACRDLEPSTLAVMHGSSFSGDGGAALRHLAHEYDHRYFSAATGLAV